MITLSFSCKGTSISRFPHSALGFPGDSEGKVSACNAGDMGSIPESRRSPGEGNGNPHQYSCLENSIDGGAWWATVHGVTKRHDWAPSLSLSHRAERRWWVRMQMRVLLENWALPSESRQEDPWGRRQQVEELEQQGRPREISERKVCSQRQDGRLSWGEGNSCWEKREGSLGVTAGELNDSVWSVALLWNQDNSPSEWCVWS